ncbi:hypothetical protein [Halobacillus litoralis]|uniref:hypothetical protein n=1 Tax=Halobacillus litoralis TaxID=45668 RepID=UPI001CD26F5A|nr:hypothetical protein [Halobacillus litoralis]MCA1021650.1 hypothetical protein [Halobacillus litoralis]
MTKKLSMKAVRANVKQKNETVTLEFHDGEYAIVIRPFFNPDDIEQVIQDFAEGMRAAKEHEANINDRHFWHFVHYHIIKVFTDLTTPKVSEKNPTADIQFFKALIKSDYYEAIMEVMQEDELVKVYDKVFDFLATHERLQEQYEKTREDVQSIPFQSEALRKRAQDNKQIPEV